MPFFMYRFSIHFSAVKTSLISDNLNVFQSRKQLQEVLQLRSVEGYGSPPIVNHGDELERLDRDRCDTSLLRVA